MRAEGSAWEPRARGAGPLMSYQRLPDAVKWASDRIHDVPGPHSMLHQENLHALGLWEGRPSFRKKLTQRFGTNLLGSTAEAYPKSLLPCSRSQGPRSMVTI
jgi:hypothetical protein